MLLNRRSFFKAVTGFVVGVCAAFVPTVKGKRPPAKEEFQDALTEVVREKLNETPWESLGCKDCYKECRHFDECVSILERLRIEAAQKAANPPMIIWRDKIEGDYWGGMELVRYQENTDGTVEELWRQKF